VPVDTSRDKELVTTLGGPVQDQEGDKKSRIGLRSEVTCRLHAIRWRNCVHGLGKRDLDESSRKVRPLRWE